MKTTVILVVLTLSSAGPTPGQAGCNDFSDDATVTYSRPAWIFSVDRPESMSWVMERSETRVKFRAMPPRMVGFEFGQTASPVTAEAFARSVSDWQPAFEIDYGGTPVQVYAGPMNEGSRAEYAALLPHPAGPHRLTVTLESASPDCDYASALEAVIRTIRPASGS